MLNKTQLTLRYNGWNTRSSASGHSNVRSDKLKVLDLAVGSDTDVVFQFGTRLVWQWKMCEIIMFWNHPIIIPGFSTALHSSQTGNGLISDILVPSSPTLPTVQLVRIVALIVSRSRFTRDLTAPTYFSRCLTCMPSPTETASAFDQIYTTCFSEDELMNACVPDLPWNLSEMVLCSNGLKRWVACCCYCVCVAWVCSRVLWWGVH